MTPAKASPQVLQAKANVQLRLQKARLAKKTRLAKLRQQEQLREAREREQAEAEAEKKRQKDRLALASGTRGAFNSAAGGGNDNPPPPTGGGTSGGSGRKPGLTDTFMRAATPPNKQAVPLAEREAAVRESYRQAGVKDAELPSYMKGTDLTKHVYRRQVQPGERLVVWVPVHGAAKGDAKGAFNNAATPVTVPAGRHFTTPGTSPHTLGIVVDPGPREKGQPTAGRVEQIWVADEAVDVLETTANEYPEGEFQGIGGKGGGQQLIMPKGWETKMKCLNCDKMQVEEKKKQ